MAANLGIPAANLPDYARALRGHGFRRTVVDVLDLDGNHITALTANVRHGQILFDRHSKAGRVLRMVIDDPSGTVNFDPDSPSGTGLYFNHMLQVSMPTWVTELAADVAAVPFTGPLFAFDRDERFVYVEAHSPEVLTRAPAWEPVTCRRGEPKDVAIIRLLESAGEFRYRVPDLSSEVLRTDVVVDRYGDRFEMAQNIAASMDLQLHYAGDGYAEVRELPRQPLWTFSTGDAVDDHSLADVVGKPRVRRSRAGLVNTVEVLGPTPLAGQPRIRGVAGAPASHKSSATKLTRGGVPGHAAVRRVLNQLQSDDQAQAIADRLQADALLSGVSPRFTALPAYHLDTGDVCALNTRDTHIPFRLDKFAVPIGTKGGPVMSVGFHLKTTPDTP